jgi:hypothetical protein
MVPVNTFFGRFGAFGIEIVLPVGVPVFAGYLFVAYIELWTDLYHEGVENSGVDIHKT